MYSKIMLNINYTNTIKKGTFIDNIIEETIKYNHD
jgi:hypothetical protein